MKEYIEREALLERLSYNGLMNLPPMEYYREVVKKFPYSFEWPFLFILLEVTKMGKLEKYFTIFAFGFFTCSAITGRYLDCKPMAALCVVFMIMTWFASLFDGGNE